MSAHLESIATFRGAQLPWSTMNNGSIQSTESYHLGTQTSPFAVGKRILEGHDLEVNS